MSKHLVFFEVKDLFYAFHHEVKLNQEDGVTIITAPNGYGKTAVLRLINALFTKDWGTLCNIIYDEAIFLFDDEAKLTIKQNRDSEKTQSLTFIYKNKVAPNECYDPYKFSLNDIDFDSLPVSLIDEVIPNLERIGPRRWLDLQNGKKLSLTEVWDSYSNTLIRELDSIGYPGKISLFTADKDPIPEWLIALTESIDCRFIETQRLLNFALSRNTPRHPRKQLQSVPVVEVQANDLRAAIQEKLAEYTNKSQALDRTFPHRVIENANKIKKFNNDLQGDIASLEVKRSKLVDVGILDSSEGYVPISIDNADPGTISLLNVYVEDNMTKLEVFDSLYSKVSTFIDIVNNKFTQRTHGVQKKIKCNKDRGLVVEIEGGNFVELNQLSSGEQHEIVLFYDIIFKMGNNTLLLIDEPELSLHVSWQKQFVPDLLDIISANEMRVLMATHSPQIVNDRRDLRVSLGVND